MKQILILSFFILLFSCNQKGNDTILTNTEVEELANKNLRGQIISSENMILIDTLKSIYLIPIGQRFLDKKENIEDRSTLGLLSTGSYKTRYYGYNNFVVYFEKNKRSINIFNKRLLLSLLERRKVGEDNILFFEGINKDSNKNGRYDNEDIKSFFVYSVENGQLKEIFEPYNHLISYNIIPNTKNIIVQFGIDRDSSGTYEMKDEPTHYLQYDFETDQKFNVIGDSLMNAMQKILDGK